MEFKLVLYLSEKICKCAQKKTVTQVSPNLDLETVCEICKCSFKIHNEQVFKNFDLQYYIPTANDEEFRKILNNISELANRMQVSADQLEEHAKPKEKT